jgi:predicted NBD/HSP70 family sugar kinase
MNDETRRRTALLASSSDAATRVFTAILTRSPISRIDVAILTGLSQAAVTKAVTPLIAEGLVDDSRGPSPTGRPGRPVSPVSIVPDALVVVGIKVNAEEIIGVATDLTSRVIASERIPSSSPEPSDVIEAVAGVFGRLEAALGPRAAHLVRVGVAVSGDVDSRAGLVRESLLMGWRAVDLGRELSARLALPVVVENDVRALTIGEHLFGLGSASFAVVTIGRGIGGGLHLGGQVVEGAFGVAGEIGHLPLASPDRVCACGRRGCVEAVASTGALVAAVSAAHGRPVSIEQAIGLGRAGDAAATSAFDEAGRVLGAAIASVVTLVGPELVVLCGEGVEAFDLLEPSLREAYAQHAFGSAGRARIVVRPHTFDDWARGAAAAAIRSLVR